MKDLSIQGNTGKGGSGHTPSESKDNLLSKQVAKVLLVVSEGEIESIDNIYLNQIPIDTYEDVVWDWRPGTADQTAISGFTEVEEPLSTFTTVQVERGTTKLPENEPEGFTPNEYFASIPWDASAARCTFSLQSLRQVTAEGDLTGYNVTLDIYTRPSANGVWTLYSEQYKKGKTSSGYAWDVRIDRPTGVTNASNWEIKVIRVSRDDSNSKKESKTIWSSVTLLYDKTLSYPNSALVSIILKDAEQFGGQVPEILFRIKGKKVKIPTNYDPNTHTYNEAVPWDGSLTELAFHYTANPAWHIYHILNDSRSGLGIAKSDIDIYSLYLLSKYCDQQVDDGGGVLEYRYECHNQFYTRENASTFLSYLLNICNANFTHNEFGQISVIFDYPGQPVTGQVTNANVVDGIFVYSSNDLETRYTQVNVTYNNKLYYGRTDTASWPASDDVLGQEMLTRYGLQTTDIVLPGCLSQRQAIHKARWAFYTNCKQTGLISFKVLFGGLLYSIGQKIRIIDNHNQNIVQSGRILAVTHNVSTTTLELDREVILDANSYTLTCLEPDGTTEIVKTVQSAGNHSSLTVSGIINPYVGGIFLLSGSVIAQEYKIIKISAEDNEYTVTALVHDEEKYSYIDDGVVIDLPGGDFGNFDGFDIPAVTNIQFQEFFSSNGVVGKGQLTVTWNWDESHAKKYFANYKLAWRKDDDQQTFVEDITVKSYDILNPAPGIYEVTIWAIHPFTGISSTPLSATYNFRVEGAASTLYPPKNIHVLGRTDTVFNTPDCNLGFDYDPANDNVSDALYDYVVEIWDSSGLNKYTTYVVKPDTNKGGTFKFSFSENANVFGNPQRTFNVKIYSRDTMGDLSAPNGEQVTNPPPILTNWSLIPDFNAIYADIQPSTELDVKEYIIFGSPTQNFIKNDASIVYAGPDVRPFLSVPSGIIYYFAFGISDTFGRDGMNISTEQSEMALSTEIDRYIYTGLIFKPNDPSANMITWTEGTATRNGTDIFPISANTVGVLWTTGVMYIYWVPGATELATSTNLINALAAHGRVIATYKGGIDVTADEGKAFIDGDQILAGSIGATQLAADTAIITSGLQLGNVIESTTWNPTTKQGWKIDKNGNIISYGSFELREAGTGDAIMLSGAIDWNKISGTDIPAANADVTYDNLAGTGVNILNNYYSFFPVSTLPDLHKSSTVTVTRETSITYFGVSSLKVSATGADGWVFLGAAIDDYNFKLSPNRKWIASLYVRCNQANKSGQIFLYLSDTTFVSAQFTTGSANSWQRLAVSFDLTNSSVQNALFRIDNDGGNGCTMYFDGLMLEEQKGGVTIPSTYSVPGATGGLSQIDQITAANISTYIANLAVGTLYIANNAITANTTYSKSTVILTQPGAVANGSVSNELFNASELVIPSVDVLTTRIVIVSFMFNHADASPGYFEVAGKRVTPETRFAYAGLNSCVHTIQYTEDIPANQTTLNNGIYLTLKNADTSTYYWNGSPAPTCTSINVTIMTGKR